MTASQASLGIFYRGSLASCQYSCTYCPFAKRRDSREALAEDAAQLERFVQWASQQTRRLHILFTPWGEALVRGYYRQALLQLAAMPHIDSVATQTNLHVPLKWLRQAPPGKLALWCSYHPSQTSLDNFLTRCQWLNAMNIPYSVGMVALREYFEDIRALRKALPSNVYLWLNAFNDKGPGYYTAAERESLQQIDPWFDYNAQPRSCAGKPCNAGEFSIAIDGDGSVRRCHFLPRVLGNLYEQDLSSMLTERACTRRMCDCYIGYSQRKDLPFSEDFGRGILMRIPESFGVSSMKGVTNVARP